MSADIDSILEWWDECGFAKTHPNTTAELRRVIAAAYACDEWVNKAVARDNRIAELERDNARLRAALVRLEDVGILCGRCEESRYADARIAAREALKI